MTRRDSLMPDLFRGGRTWNPIRDMNRLQRRMDHIFDEFLAPVPSVLRTNRDLMGFGEEEEMFSPACDIDETDTHYLLSFDLPGVAKDEVKLEFRDGQLVVSGERKKESRHKEGLTVSAERCYGRFQRSFALPQSVHAEKIEANYQNGILQIVIPKVEASRVKEIPIKEEHGGIFKKFLPKPEKEIKSEKVA